MARSSVDRESIHSGRYLVRSRRSNRRSDQAHICCGKRCQGWRNRTRGWRRISCRCGCKGQSSRGLRYLRCRSRCSKCLGIVKLRHNTRWSLLPNDWRPRHVIATRLRRNSRSGETLNIRSSKGLLWIRAACHAAPSQPATDTCPPSSSSPT